MGGIPDEVVKVWEKLTGPALTQAGEALAQMTGLFVSIQNAGARQVPWPALSGILALEHPEADALYGVQLDANGLFEATILLLFTEESARRLVSVLMGEDIPLPLDGMGESALGEVGNVTGTAFLNVFANAFHRRWEPSPPKVRHGSLDALAAGLWPEAAQHATVLISEAIFTIRAQAIDGYVAVIPRVGPGGIPV
ncbi:Chemotaxis protein CheC -- inhibitor of MCP methylation [Candidatus Hydrogenisulfobacillus filiaventi]|uniref:Chemotaxis protein CheC -- inhibitor of MCP methylation n=1 Tax=Candidatus Hydrogenisulfobacillus filiaventi TaxID=2707344 RepID=A0A6F8ZD52_9FIRM|nr:chemotaxis protein CheC [Bacillota bacterium]CAB1127946.1 Chemotaxis protein CheC -- inhibitor of MCP methylation [Candidatus Hydrogenisulfobacillus filiaventi]